MLRAPKRAEQPPSADVIGNARDPIRVFAKEGLPSLKRPTSPRHHVFQDR